MVNYTEEDFSKLSQLDRIEFRQKWDECGSTQNINSSCTMLFILAVVCFVGGYETLGSGFFLMAAFAIIINIFLMIITSATEKRDQKYIEGKYFEVKVKGKK